MRLPHWILATCLILMLGAMPCRSSAPPEGKSLGKALLLSLAMPGAGEQYLGAQGRARAFFVSEAAIWTSFACFRVQGGMREDAYKQKAHLFAGVVGARGEAYYRLLAYYMSSEECNVDILREARLRYPDDRAQQLAYFDANGYFGTDGWQWESLQDLRDYSHERTLSRESYRQAVLTTGFAVLNRMVSLIDVYLSFKLDGAQGKGHRLGLAIEPTPYQGFRLCLRAPF